MGLVASVIPGPGAIGGGLGFLMGSPLFMIAFGKYKKYKGLKEQQDEVNPIDISKGVEQNKSKEWRDMEREKKMELIKAGAEAAPAIGKAVSSGAQAVSSIAEKKTKDKEVKQWKETAKEEREARQEAKDIAANAREEAQEAKQEKEEMRQSPNLPSKCPKCGTSWSGGLLGSGNVETYSNGRKASCTECRHTEILYRE